MKSSVPPDVLPGLPVSVPYVWRDPARVSPERLAELAERDRRLAAIQRVESARARAHGRAPDAEARYFQLRGEGVSISECARRMGVERRQCQRWERARERQAGQP